MSCNCNNKTKCGCPSTPKVCPVKNTTQPVDSCKDKCGKGGLDENVMSGKLGHLGIMKEGSETRFTTIPLSAINFLGRELGHDIHNPTFEDRLTYIGGIIEERKSVTSMLDGKKSLVNTYYQLEHTIIPTPTEGGWTVEIRKREILPGADVRCVDGILKIMSPCPEQFLSDETELYNIRKDGIDGKLIIKGTLPLDVFDDFCGVLEKLVHYSKAKDGFGEELETSDLFKCDGTLNTDKYLLGETYATDDCKIGTMLDKEKLLHQIFDIVKTCKTNNLFTVKKIIDECGKASFCVEFNPAGLDGLVKINMTKPATVAGGALIADDKFTRVNILKETVSTKPLTPACPDDGRVSDCGACGTNCNDCNDCADTKTQVFNGTLVGAFSAGTNQSFTFSSGGVTAVINGNVTIVGGVTSITGTIKGNLAAGNIAGSVISQMTQACGTVQGTISANLDTECSRASYSSEMGYSDCDFKFDKSSDGLLVLRAKDKLEFEACSFVQTPIGDGCTKRISLNPNKLQFDSSSFTEINCADGCSKKVFLKENTNYFSVPSNLVLDPIDIPISGETYRLYSFGVSLGNATLSNNVLRTNRIGFQTLPNAPTSLRPCHTWGLEVTFQGVAVNNSYQDVVNDTVYLVAYYYINGNRYTYQIKPDGTPIAQKIRSVSKGQFPGGSNYPNEARLTPISFTGVFPVNATGNNAEVEFEAIFSSDFAPLPTWSVCFGNNFIVSGRYVQIPTPNCVIPTTVC